MMLKSALILSLALVSAVPSTWAQCDPPVGYDNTASTVFAGLTTTVASVQPSYASGDLVEFTVIITNTGDTERTIAWPVEYPDALIVTPVDCADVEACLEEIVFSSPPFLMYVPGSVTLAPGECRVRTMTWDTTEDPAPAGHYVAWGGLMAWTVDPQVDPLGDWITVPAQLTIEIADVVGNEATTWGGLKACYSD